MDTGIYYFVSGTPDQRHWLYSVTFDCTLRPQRNITQYPLTSELPITKASCSNGINMFHRINKTIGWVHEGRYFTNVLFIDLEATVGTYELRSYGVEQNDIQGVPLPLKKTISFWLFFWLTISWNDPSLPLVK